MEGDRSASNDPICRTIWAENTHPHARKHTHTHTRVIARTSKTAHIFLFPFFVFFHIRTNSAISCNCHFENRKQKRTTHSKATGFCSSVLVIGPKRLMKKLFLACNVCIAVERIVSLCMCGFFMRRAIDPRDDLSLVTRWLFKRLVREVTRVCHNSLPWLEKRGELGKKNCLSTMKSRGIS